MFEHGFLDKIEAKGIKSVCETVIFNYNLHKMKAIDDTKE